MASLVYAHERADDTEHRCGCLSRSRGGGHGAAGAGRGRAGDVAGGRSGHRRDAESVARDPETRRTARAARSKCPRRRRAGGGGARDDASARWGSSGKLNTVSPTASMIHMQLGYEPFRWLLVFAESDLAFTSTRYAAPVARLRHLRLRRGRAVHRPRERTRFAVRANRLRRNRREPRRPPRLRIQGRRQLEWLLRRGRRLEWYQVDPHYALALNGGVRKAQGFERLGGSDSALAWLGGVALRYTF